MEGQAEAFRFVTKHKTQKLADLDKVPFTSLSLTHFALLLVLYQDSGTTVEDA
jgi:hypothetical protein